MVTSYEELLRKSKELEQKASQYTGIAPVLGGLSVPKSVAISPITGQSLIQQPALNPVNINPPPIYPVATLNSTPTVAPLTPTAPEQQATDLSSRLQALNERLLGQSQYRAEQETALGLPEMQKVQNDLQVRLKTLQNEALQIPLQLQQQAEGRGITAGGLQPIQTASLRNNAIQALGVSSLLEASRGNLALAMEQVDRSVAQRFDPIKEEIAIKKANLDLILKSPEYSLADKNRAQAQKDAQDARTKDIARKEENVKVAQAMAAAAMKLNPNNSTVSFNAQQVLNLNPDDSQYLQKAFALVGQYQVDPTTTQREILNLQKLQAEVANIPLSRRKALAEISKIEAEAKGKAGGSTEDTLALVNAVIENPELFNQLTPTEKGKIAPTLNQLGFTAFGKPLSDTAVKEITQTETAIENIKELKDIVQQNEQYIGPIAGLQKYNPYSKARQVQADVDRIRQRIGKALEGGVLRKEDEDKYKKILATLTDTPETALYKINQLIKDLERDVSTYKKNQALSGRNVSGGIGGTVIMTSPDGKQYNVPGDKVDIFKQNGFKTL